MGNGSAQAVELYVRGELPREMEGSLVVACNRRHKDRTVFSRWHDSQADLVRIDITPGKPGRARANMLAVDPSGRDVGAKMPGAAKKESQPSGKSRPHYLTQPNHGLN